MADPIAPFAPALAELGLDAWERCGLKPGELTVAHLTSMRRSMNFVLVRWANNGINLWEVASASIPLIAGQATYAMPATLIEMLDSYISVTSNTFTVDTPLTQMGRDTFAALSNKAQPGRPLQVWFNRQITPSITLWPVPDLSNTYTLTYYGWSQIGDADPAGGNTANLPYRFLEAFTASVAAHLAMKWAPERAQALVSYAEACFTEAAENDVEHVTLSMAPNLDGYFS